MKNFPRGIFYNLPHPKAPTWILGSIAISKDNFLAWLNETPANEKGYIKLDIKEGKEGKNPYLALNDYVLNPLAHKEPLAPLSPKAQEIAKQVNLSDDLNLAEDETDLGF